MLFSGEEPHFWLSAVADEQGALGYQSLGVGVPPIQEQLCSDPVSDELLLDGKNIWLNILNASRRCLANSTARLEKQHDLGQLNALSVRNRESANAGLSFGRQQGKYAAPVGWVLMVHAESAQWHGPQGKSYRLKLLKTVKKFDN
jgi:hypothetical protein